MTHTLSLAAVDTISGRPTTRSSSKFVELERRLHISPFQKVDADTDRISRILSRLEKLRLLIPGDATEETIYRVAERIAHGKTDPAAEFTTILGLIASEVTRAIEMLKPLAGLIGHVERSDLMQFVHYRLKNDFSVGCFKRFGRYIVDRPDRHEISVSEIGDRMRRFLAQLKPRARGREATAISQFERGVESCCIKKGR